VDLTITKNNEEQNLGGQQLNEKDQLNHKDNSNQIKHNRSILKSALSPYFNNNKDEWWHWGLK
jgi:D-alanyl-D-alanine dipeptidase